MGMPVEVDIPGADTTALEAIFSYLTDIDARFSTYKDTSEISRINRGELSEAEWSSNMREVFALAAQTQADTDGYFDIKRPDGYIDPSGVVKGWAIREAAKLAESLGYADYFISVGGDIASRGADQDGAPWTVGIRNPFNAQEIVKVLKPSGSGVATSGNYIRGDHIYNPHAPSAVPSGVASLTVVGPDVFEADRFATAAFAMGRDGIFFIEGRPGLEGYSIDDSGIATMTSGFSSYIA